jgi:FlaA1/EpsC-like NDP-sugar epimerase
VIKKLTVLPQKAKHFIMLAADLIMLPLALWCSVALRLGESPPPGSPPAWAYLIAVAVTVPLFVNRGLYRAIIRYLETRAFLLIIGVSLVSAGMFSVVVAAFRVPGIPGSSLVIYAVLSSGYAVLARLIARQMLRGSHRARQTGARVVIYGAGDAGHQLAQAFRAGAEFVPVAFVDDNPSLWGRSIMGLPVHGGNELTDLVRKHEIAKVIVAMTNLTPGERSRLLQRLEPLNVEVRLVPRIADLIRGDLSVADVREVRPEDLLGRDAVQLDGVALDNFLLGQVVMVTGAGGSIGSELCRQIARYRPSRLVLFEVSEFALYSLREEFVALHPDVQVECAVGDVKNPMRVHEIVGRFRPAVVFHAAAYKHVPLMEELNSWEAVRNNTLGTYVVGKAAIEHGVRKFVLVSTDKAVNPTNVMGATKRLAEVVCQALHSPDATHFEIVRFGNVLGSSGSVIPKFRDQIAAGGPITVTHPAIVRYFMSIPEAAQLVLQAACMGQGGEIFVLDMGEPVRIVDLARNMIRLSGYSESEISIEFTGLRPGEKLYEELLADSESTRPTHHPKIRVAKVSPAVPGLWQDLYAWLVSEGNFSDAEVRSRIASLLPEYKPWSVVKLAPSQQQSGPPSECGRAEGTQLIG